MTQKRDCLIIRNSVDWTTGLTNWMGWGLKEALERRGWSAADLSGPNASPENVRYWLQSGSRKISRMVVVFDHGYPDSLSGQHGFRETTVLDRENVGELTRNLDVYTFACATGKRGGLGEYAVRQGCRSWLGYVGTVYWDSNIADDFKSCVWSYVLAMADGMPPRACCRALADSYRKLACRSMICRWDLSRLAYYDRW